MFVMVRLCLLGQESAYVWPVDGDPAKIQTGVKCLYRKGEEIGFINYPYVQGRQRTETHLNKFICISGNLIFVTSGNL